MKLICPVCGATVSLEAWVQDAKARECLSIVASLPEVVASHIPGYLGLFRPRSKALSWSKALRVLQELSAHVRHGWIQWDRGVARPATDAMWGAGLEKMVSRPPRDLPLENHNYLRKIVYGLADETDRQAEYAHNRAERSGTIRTDTGSGLSSFEEYEVIPKEVLRATREKILGKRRKDREDGDG